MKPLRGGDAVFFFGKGILSGGIELFTHGPSHMEMILPPELSTLPDGTTTREVSLIGSTISDRDNGVQCCSLADRIAHYDAGGVMVAAYLRDDVRAFLDFPAMWEYAKASMDKRYNVLEIGAYILNTFLPGALQIDAPAKNAAVCSEFCAELYRAGGWPGLDPFRTPPDFFWRGRFWSGAELLRGEIPTNHMKDFNHV